MSGTPQDSIRALRLAVERGKQRRFAPTSGITLDFADALVLLAVLDGMEKKCPALPEAMPGARETSGGPDAGGYSGQAERIVIAAERLARQIVKAPNLGDRARTVAALILNSEFAMLIPAVPVKPAGVEPPQGAAQDSVYHAMGHEAKCSIWREDETGYHLDRSRLCNCVASAPPAAAQPGTEEH